VTVVLVQVNSAEHLNTRFGWMSLSSLPPPLSFIAMFLSLRVCVLHLYFCRISEVILKHFLWLSPLLNTSFILSLKGRMSIDHVIFAH
jgi:hypothetical protein